MPIHILWQKMNMNFIFALDKHTQQIEWLQKFMDYC